MTRSGRWASETHQGAEGVALAERKDLPLKHQVESKFENEKQIVAIMTVVI